MDKHNYNFIHCSKPTDKEHKLNKREDSSTTASRSLRDGKIKASSAVIKLSQRILSLSKPLSENIKTIFYLPLLSMNCEKFGKRAKEDVDDIMLSVAMTNIQECGPLGHAPALSTHVDPKQLMCTV